MGLPVVDNFRPYLQRFENAEWRTLIFRDLVLAEFGENGFRKQDSVLLDIGCGHGFDMDEKIQRVIATGAKACIGVEPDAAMQVGDHIQPVHRCFFEDAPIAPGSVDVAFAVMVLEHLPQPQRFWDQLHKVLRPGGVFWGFTVNRHHPFAAVSTFTGKVGLKDLYLNALLGRRSEERYENYPTFYRSNTPETIRELARQFTQTDFLLFTRRREMNAYLPKILHPLSGIYDQAARMFGLPGSAVMAVRAVK